MKTSHALAIAVLLCTGTLAGYGDDPGRNLLNNGDMALMEKSGNVVRAWAYPKESRIVQINGKNAIEFKGGLSQWGLVLPPGKYQLSFHLKKDNTNWLGIRLYCRDMENKEIKDVPGALSHYIKGEVIKEWTQREFTFNVPQSKNCGLIFSTHGGVMTIGNVSLVRLDEKAEAAK